MVNVVCRLSNRKFNTIVMIQDILTGISVLGAFIYVAISFGKVIYNSFISKTSLSCGGGCSGCSAKTELLQEVKKSHKYESRKWEIAKTKSH